MRTITEGGRASARSLPAFAAAAVLAATLPMSVSAQAEAPTATAIVDTSVITLADEGMLQAQTVLVEGGRIAEIGPAADVAVPVGADVIDGQGGYLIPGLANGHFHVEGDPTNLTLALANGQTTVTAFNASPEDMALAAEIAAGERIGPRIITGPNVTGLLPITEYTIRRVAEAAGPLFDTGLLLAEAGVTLDAEGAESIVTQVAETGADFMKINVFVNREVFDATVAAAAEYGLPVTGHVSSQIGVEHFVESGAHIQHALEIEPYMSSTDIQGIPVQAYNPDLMDEKLPGLIELMVEHDQVVTPTLFIGQQLARIFDDPDALMARPELRYVSPAVKRGWSDPEVNLLYANIGTAADNPGLADAVLAYNQRLARDLYQAGIPLIAGTDAGHPVPWSVLGFELPEELELFVEAGMSPTEALRSATIVTASHYGQSDEWGTIEVGKEADLVLLGSDPLADVGNVRDIRGVMLGGVWLPQVELQAMLDEIAAGFEAQASIQLEPYTNAELGITGVAPAGWIELEPGVLTRSDPESDPTFLIQLAAPADAAGGLVDGVLENFGAVAGGDVVDSFEIGDLSWQLFMPEAEVGVVVAVAATDDSAYLVALAALPGEIEALTESVLQPAVAAFTPAS